MHAIGIHFKWNVFGGDEGEFCRVVCLLRKDFLINKDCSHSHLIRDLDILVLFSNSVLLVGFPLVLVKLASDSVRFDYVS